MRKKKDSKFLLDALVKGWKLRQILNGCKETLQLKEKVYVLNEKLKKKAFNPQIKEELQEERFFEVSELIRVVHQFMGSSRWIYSYQKPAKPLFKEDVTYEQLQWDPKCEEPVRKQAPKRMPTFDERPLAGKPI